MQLELRTRAKKWIAGTAAVLAAGAYIGVAVSRLTAELLAQSPELSKLRWAVRLDPASAEYRHALGAREVALQSPAEALFWLHSAVALNSHKANYWMDLAVAQQQLGDASGENSSLRSALAAGPHIPEITWHAAQFLVALGSTDQAMKQFRTVLESDPPMAATAISTLWAIRPDTDFLLDNVVPASGNAPLLGFLLSRNDTTSAAKVWNKMFSQQQSVERGFVLGYVRYLLAHQEVSQAEQVWCQAATLSDLAAYQPSPENLLVNGDFSLDILNAGFDWRHQPVTGVSIALDPNEAHSSVRSLRISLEGDSISDAGISETVPVEPGTQYQFSAFYKAKNMDGAGAMQFAVHDAYRATLLYSGEDLKNADFWRNTGGNFVTPSDTRLVLVHLIRVPANRPIRGTLWVDGLRLVLKRTEHP